MDRGHYKEFLTLIKVEKVHVVIFILQTNKPTTLAGDLH